MREWFLENWEFIASVITILVTCIASIFGVTVKMRADKKALEIANTGLQEEKLRLERAIVEGSYIICPKCGHRIFLRDVEIKTKGVNDGQENE